MEAFGIAITFIGGFYLGKIRERIKKENVQITEVSQEKGGYERTFTFNNGRPHQAQMLAQSIDEESKVSNEVPELLLDTLVEEIPYILFTLTYNTMEKHWLSRPKGKILIMEDRIDDAEHVFDRVRLYVNDKEIKLERHEQIRVVNSLITVNGNMFHNLQEKKD
jgi:hypothetical protein